MIMNELSNHPIRIRLVITPASTKKIVIVADNILKKIEAVKKQKRVIVLPVTSF
ncbi:28757_t:CDS:2 [Racocetra persica]|uniref:28757_t:CDS:1 n=1 Tax=Racocetra persica TaxID=160502 RepID=A0ACA9RMC5_9GLOM|nr:28757_t:CDS:2 [Racocetra persica]